MGFERSTDHDFIEPAPVAERIGLGAQGEQGASALLQVHLPPRPNGGMIAWMQVAGSWCLMCNCWGLVNAYGVFQTYYETRLLKEQTPSSIAWIGSIQAFLMLFAGTLVGPVYDNGHFRLLLAVGTFLIVFGMMMVSLCTEYWQFILAQGIVVGLGGGCLYVPSIAILPSYFSTRMAFAMGVAGSGSGIGGALYPIAFQRLESSVGFAWATRIIAFIVLATLVFPLLFMRVRIAPSVIRKSLNASAWTEPPFSLFCIGGFLAFIGVYMPLYYVTLYAIEKGIMSSELAFYLLPILNAASIVGRIVPNYGADKTGPLNMLIPTCLGLATLSFAWISIQSTTGLIVFSVFYGFFIGAFMTLPFSSVVRLSPNIGEVGTRMGMVGGVASIGVLIGTPMGGAILRHAGWMVLQSVGGAILVASAIAILASRVAKGGCRLTTKV